VDASDSVVDDACQHAWDALLRNQSHVRSDTALAWLTRTAVREAVRMLHRAQRYASLDDPVVRGSDGSVPSGAGGPEEVILQRERLASLGSLTRRQQQMVWLQSFGLSYAEIAAHTGCTARTVERQLLRAKRRVRIASAEYEQGGCRRPAPSYPRPEPDPECA
jgi:DNA-directed RNA polymerase specialized sigma24 family protein